MSTPLLIGNNCGMILKLGRRTKVHLSVCWLVTFIRTGILVETAGRSARRVAHARREERQARRTRRLAKEYDSKCMTYFWTDLKMQKC